MLHIDGKEWHHGVCKHCGKGCMLRAGKGEIARHHNGFVYCNVWDDTDNRTAELEE